MDQQNSISQLKNLIDEVFKRANPGMLQTCIITSDSENEEFFTQKKKEMLLLLDKLEFEKQGYINKIDNIRSEMQVKPIIIPKKFFLKFIQQQDSQIRRQYLQDQANVNGLKNSPPFTLPAMLTNRNSAQTNSNSAQINSNSTQSGQTVQEFNLHQDEQIITINEKLYLNLLRLNFILLLTINKNNDQQDIPTSQNDLQDSIIKELGKNAQFKSPNLRQMFFE